MENEANLWIMTCIYEHSQLYLTISFNSAKSLNGDMSTEY